MKPMNFFDRDRDLMPFDLVLFPKIEPEPAMGERELEAIRYLIALPGRETT